MPASESERQRLIQLQSRPGKRSMPQSPDSTMWQVKVNSLANLVPTMDKVSPAIAGMLTSMDETKTGGVRKHRSIPAVSPKLAKTIGQAKRESGDVELHRFPTSARAKAVTQLPRLQTFGQSSRVTHETNESRYPDVCRPPATMRRWPERKCRRSKIFWIRCVSNFRSCPAQS